MDRLRNCHTEWSKSDREAETSQEPLYVEFKKQWFKGIYLKNRNRLMDLENELMVAKGHEL